MSGPAQLRRAGWPALLLALAALACAQFGSAPTVPPPPATAVATQSPGQGDLTQFPGAPTQPAPTDGAAVTPAATSAIAGSPLPPLEGEVLSLVAAIGPEMPGSVLDMRISPDGTLWLLTDQAVARLASGSWEIYLSEFEGELAGLDDYGRVWVVAPDGATINAWDGSEWQSFGSAQGWTPLPEAAGRALVQSGPVGDQLGRVWVATSSDVRAFDGEEWQVFDRAALGLSGSTDAVSTQITLHVAQPGGTVWVSVCDFGGPGPLATGGVRWLEADAWQGAGTPLDTGCGGAIASSPTGAVWVGLNDTVMQLDPGTGEWTPHPAPAPPAGQRFGYVSDLALDPLEQPWPLMLLCGGASCDQGQVRYQLGVDGAWQQVGGAVSAPQTVAFDIAGNAWLMSEESVLRASNGDLRSAGQLRVLGSATDSSGQVYVAAERGGQTALWLVNPVVQ